VKTILVTGGLGFIGSNFVRRMLREHPAERIVNFDAMTYAGNPENLRDIEASTGYEFVHGNICDRAAVERLFAAHDFDAVVHFAAESHVDRSIAGPDVFVMTNVIGTQIMVDVARAAWKGSYDNRRFLHVSTDEVYGSLGPTDFFCETTPIAPNSPYSASKAGSDLIALAYHHTYGFPTLLTRCSNNYGPYQYPEKLIPVIIINALHDKALPVYGDGMQVRDWLYVDDHCSAIDTVLRTGTVGEAYNIGGNNEMPNIAIVKLILRELKKPESLITHVTDRLGHDRRYAIDARKIKRDLGWSPSARFEEGIVQTIRWYVDNRKWWESLQAKRAA
jgi:dTDP-glucose 4,6-dehydratase